MMDIQVTSVRRTLAEGDVLSVYGTLHPGQRIEAIETVRKPAGGYWRTRALSLLAGLWVLCRGLRHWRPDIRTMLIQRRDSPLSLSDSEDTDA